MEPNNSEENFFPDEGIHYSVEYLFEKFGGILLGFDSEQKFDEMIHAPKFEKYGSTIIEKKLGKKVLDFYTHQPAHKFSQIIDRYAKAVIYRLMYPTVTNEKLIEAEGQIPFNFRELNYIDDSTAGNEMQNSYSQQRAYLNSRLRAIKEDILQKQNN